MSQNQRTRSEQLIRKLSNPNFDWSKDCNGKLCYDEWVSFTATKALVALKAGK